MNAAAIAFASRFADCGKMSTPSFACKLYSYGEYRQITS